MPACSYNHGNNRVQLTCRPCVLLADDHLETAELLRALLQPEFDVIALCAGRPHAGQRCRAPLADVIVSDITMPGLDGIAAASAILRGIRRRGSFS